MLRIFALTGMDRIIPNFTNLDQALAQTSANGLDGQLLANGAPAGNAQTTLVAQPCTSGPDREAC